MFIKNSNKFNIIIHFFWKKCHFRLKIYIKDITPTKKPIFLTKYLEQFQTSSSGYLLKSHQKNICQWTQTSKTNESISTSNTFIAHSDQTTTTTKIQHYLFWFQQIFYVYTHKKKDIWLLILNRKEIDPYIFLLFFCNSE